MPLLERHIPDVERLFEPDSDQSSPVRLAKRLGRSVYLAGRGFMRDACFHDAGALAFDTLLALVPLTALLAGVLRSMGAWDTFVASFVEPWLKRTLGPGTEDQVTMRDAVLTVIELGERADLQGLGFVGLIASFYLLGVLLMAVETTFNRIFGVVRARRPLRRAADYAAILFVLPAGLVLASALGLSSSSWDALGPAADLVGELVAMSAAIGAFTFLYMVMPHTSVRLRSALLGGIVAGALWHFGLEVYASLQVGVSRYNALYSSLAALPLFLVWTFVSWLLVLLGAELAAAHQDSAGFRWRVRNAEPSVQTRHDLGVRLMAMVARAFVRGEAPASTASMAATIGSPPRFAQTVLDDLARGGLVTRAQTKSGAATYVLSRDPRTVRVSEVLLQLDNARDPYELVHKGASSPETGIGAVLEQLEAARRQSQANVTLHELALSSEPPAEVSDAA